MTETDLLESRHKDENGVLTLAETVLNGVRDEESNNLGHASHLSGFDLRLFALMRTRITYASSLVLNKNGLNAAYIQKQDTTALRKYCQVRC